MASEASMVVQARLALRQGRFLEARELLKQIPVTSPDWEPARLWVMRSWVEQGFIEKGSALATQYLEEVLPSISDPLSLWSRFILILKRSVRVTDDEWDSFRLLCEEVSANGETAPLARAVARDLAARTLLLRINLNRAQVSLRTQVAQQIVQAAVEYGLAGDALEARAAKSRSADILRREPLANRDAARQLLGEVIREATSENDDLGLAEAELALAEMDLEDYLQSAPENRSVEQNQAVLAAFDSIAVRLETAGHYYAQPKAIWKCARLLLGFGIEEGVEIAHQAADALEKANEQTLCQEIWQQLSTWHTYRGETVEAGVAQQRIEQLSQRIEFGLAASVDSLTQADAAFRTGQLGHARQLLKSELEQPGPSALRNTYRFTLSVTAATGGLKDEAIDLLQQILAELEPIGANSLSAQAAFQMANLLGVDSFDAALQYLELAYSMQATLKDQSEMGQILAHRAWLQVQYRRKAAQHPLVSDEVIADFDAALQLLNHNFTLVGQLHLGNLCQYRGQAAFFDANWPECGQWFECAEQIFRGAHLNPQLAFTLVHEALAGIQLGRAHGTALYDDARSRLEEAQQLFESSHLWSLIWQLWFYRGLCDMEAARWEMPNNREQQSRWERANHCFEKADWWITELRGFAGAGAKREEQSITFNVDKQLLYQQAFQLAWRERVNPASALAWLERMKGRVFLDILASTALPPATLAKHPLIEREQALREQKQHAKNSQTALKLQRERDELLEALAQESSTAEYAALCLSKPVEWAEIRDVLKREQTEHEGRRLIVAEFYYDERQAMLFGLCADWEQPKVEVLNVNTADLEKFSFRGGVRVMLNDMGEEAWQRFGGLIAPLEAWSDPEDIICLIPYGKLHDLPLHTLNLGITRLIDRNPVFYSPSASVLKHTLGRHRGRSSAPERIVVFGDSLLDLPRSRAEAEEIAQRFGVDAYLGPDVTRGRFMAALTGAAIVHFAGHGKVSASGGFESGLSLGQNDFLRVVNIIGTSSVAELVVLSGCETGVNWRHVGDELVGLVRAFLFAGVGSLLVSQWKVNDTTTQTLLTQFYAAYDSGLPKVDALQAAMREIQRIAPEKTFYYWAAFTLVGDWK